MGFRDIPIIVAVMIELVLAFLDCPYSSIGTSIVLRFCFVIFADVYDITFCWYAPEITQCDVSFP